MWIVIAIVVVAVVIVVVAFLAQKGASSAQARVEDSLASLDVRRQDKVHCHAAATEGEGQTRRLGTLALTPDELVFVQFVPPGEVRVPLAAVTKVETARSFLGKEHTTDLMVVSWATESEGTDSQVAFDVPDIESWRADLEQHA
jgi:hypothetical protein